MLEHLLFDIETLGTREDTVILSIACVPFHFEVHECFDIYRTKGYFIKLDAQEQIRKYRRSISVETIEWWKKQSNDAKEWNLKPHPEDRPLVDGLIELSRFIGQTAYNFKESYVFARGTYFDFPKLEHAYEVSAGLKTPFNTFKIRDVRTYIDIMAGVSDGSYDVRFCDTTKFVKHDCLHDAAMDATRLNELYYIATENPAF